ncbi:HNH endonuclease [Exiguobacterium acetylicum]|uniref:HNH endonuclease n=1 Tax=Exiguobacterium acetylicum TaxID=41170 RepID=UPI0027E0321D|nr:HNH endonuclease [Exiguobacterium acetylicum]MDQ6468024.1 HNH endonuclease [Exiguobacterium acetylicum]
MHFLRSEGRYFTKKILIESNTASIREKRQRQLDEEFLETLDDSIIYPIIISLDEHNKGEIRVLIILDEKRTLVSLDISKDRYSRLPKAIQNNDGTTKIETEEEINARRLYPEGREYIEVVSRKIIRDSAFRRKVLIAYGNQCAICEVKKISLLVAAHIYPAHMCGDDSINNGICLCKMHDKLYEDGDIFINGDGKVFVQSKNHEAYYQKIRMPLNEENKPSSLRLTQKLRLSLSLKK